MAGLIENISNIYKRISHAAMRAGRGPEDILLIAVTKGVSLETMKEAVDAGLRLFGENRVQETVKKIKDSALISDNIKWHMIGHLQKNKARAAVRLFDLIHSVDSIELMGLINNYAGESGRVQKILIELKLSHEEAKHGIEKDKLGSLIKEARAMRSLAVEGLMTMPPYSDDPEKSRTYFRELRSLRDEHRLKELSMGMTNDFEVAIEEGSTMVRIGTGIFGERR